MNNPAFKNKNITTTSDKECSLTFSGSTHNLKQSSTLSNNIQNIEELSGTYIFLNYQNKFIMGIIFMVEHVI